MEDRIKFINIFIIITLIGIGLRFAYLQIVKYSFYNNLAKKNCIRTIEIGIPRGEIFDRDGRILAKDQADFNLVFSPYDIKNPQNEAKILSPIIGVDENKLIKIFSKKSENPFYRKILELNISKEEMTKIEEYSFQLPGIYIQLGINREYALGKASAQLIGYVGEISQQQLDQMHGEGLESGDYIGQYGLEKEYNKFLMGKPEGYEVVVNALGQQVKILHKTKLIPGDNLVLNIDKSLQKICYNDLGNQEGAIVAMNPNNGQILALVSRPSFNPDDIAKYLRPPYSDNNPFLDRTIAGQFAPASIFKIITSTAGLEGGYIGEHSKFNCPAKIKIGNRRILHNWDPVNLGRIDIDTALPISNDIFFAKLAMRIGVHNLLSWAKAFGLGVKTGIDLPGEKPGSLPSDKNGPLGEAVNIAIGQGPILMTPLQICREMSIIANGGNIWQPYIVKKITSPEGNTIKTFYPFLQRTVFISNKTLKIIRKDMINVVAWPNGTGHNAYIPGLQIAGKTGTAETGPRHLNLPLRGAFACYAPADHPSIALVVYLDYTPSSAFAAEIAGKILKEYFLPTIGQNTTSETGIKQSGNKNTPDKNAIKNKLNVSL